MTAAGQICACVAGMSTCWDGLPSCQFQGALWLARSLEWQQACMTDSAGEGRNGVGPTQDPQASSGSEAGAGSSQMASAGHTSSIPSLLVSETSTDDETVGRRHHGNPQASATAATHPRQQSGTAGGLGESQIGFTAHDVAGSQQQAAAAAASFRLQDDDSEPPPPSAAPRGSHGRQVESDDVPGPPPGSPPAAQGSMGGQAGGPELHTSALFSASTAEWGPDASEDSNEDTDTDSGVFFGPDLAGESDPWCASPSMTRSSTPETPVLHVRSTAALTAAAHAGYLGMLLGLEVQSMRVGLQGQRGI